MQVDPNLDPRGRVGSLFLFQFFFDPLLHSIAASDNLASLDSRGLIVLLTPDAESRPKFFFNHLLEITPEIWIRIERHRYGHRVPPLLSSPLVENPIGVLFFFGASLSLV